MSWIFEALQEAELDRTGQVAPGHWLAVTELIRGSEQDIKPEENLGEPLQTSRRLHSAIPADSRLVASAQPLSFGAEKFRFMALQLGQLQQRRRLHKLLVTSTAPEEGKSFVSANLAITLARGHRVLLVDGDFRRPVLGKKLGVGNHPGLSECLRRELALSNAIHHIEDLGLWFLPAGDLPEGSVDAIPSGQLAESLSALYPFFDWIIIDSPPLLPLTDASVWCRVVDGTLLVTREGATKKRDLKRGIEMLDKSTIVGVVVNHCTSAGQDNQYQPYVCKLKDSECELSKANA